MPEPKTGKKFMNYSAQYKTNFCLYFDFESIASKCCDTKRGEKVAMERLDEHFPISVSA